MNKYTRVILFLVLLAGVTALAWNQVAWATPSADQSLSASQDEAPSVALPKKGDDPCILPNGKVKNKCKGTVKPPPSDVVVEASGHYSVGGFCPLDIELLDPQTSLHARLETPLPKNLPDGVHKVRQGCRLTYYSDGERVDTLSPAAGSAMICFAGIGKKEMTLHFYDIYSAAPVWVALETTNEDGIACAPGIGSGVYVATFQAP